ASRRSMRRRPVSRRARAPSSASARPHYDARMSGAHDAVELALFPLANVVLFPRIHCPLHIFEPRYRQMTTDALAGSRQIGMATVRPEHAEQMSGDPPLFSIGCAGTIRRAQRYDDGRYDIVLFGTQRFRIEHEIPREGERLYRVARVELL